MSLSGIPDWLPPGNPVLLAPNLQGEVFTDQITVDVCTYDHANKLFIPLVDIDHDMVEDI